MRCASTSCHRKDNRTRATNARRAKKVRSEQKHAAKGAWRRCREGTETAGPRLTLQPIRHKLRLIKHMRSKANRVRLVALLLGIIFLGAQFHFCADLSASGSSPSATHFCPVCSVVGSAVATQSPTIALIPAANRLEVVSLVLVVSSAFPRATSPRAPPAL